MGKSLHFSERMTLGGSLELISATMSAFLADTETVNQMSPLDHLEWVKQDLPLVSDCDYIWFGSTSELVFDFFCTESPIEMFAC